MTIKLIRLFLPILIWIANSLKRPGKRGGQRAFQPLPPKKPENRAFLGRQFSLDRDCRGREPYFFAEFTMTV